MPSSSSSSTKQRAQGGGRKANSEPRIQVFKEFGGCNFELAPHTPQILSASNEQSDLQMNYVAVQNNASITSNKTIETRNNVVKLCGPPYGRQFTDACILVGAEFYIGLDDGSLAYYTINWFGANFEGYVSLTDRSTNKPGHHWEGFAYADGKLIGTTKEDQLWVGNIGTHAMHNAAKIPNPTALSFSDLRAMGDLKISASQTDACPHRIAVAYSLVNEFGPTKCSNQRTFYASHPVDEWHGGRYLQVGVSTLYDVAAVEIYFTTGNSSTLLLAGRTDEFYDTYGPDPSGSGALVMYETFAFNWYGYLDATSMWPVANLIAPTDNYTEGPRCSYITCIDSRLYFWGDSQEPQRLYIGGNSGNLLSVSPGTGGGFVDVEPGTGQEIRVVTKYKTQSGASIVTMLCDSENAQREQRFNLVENSVALSTEQSMKSWQAEQVAGAVGCKSPYGALVCEDGLYAVSRYGLALTTMTMEYNSQIRVNYVSDAIKPAFTDGHRVTLDKSILTECDGIIYLAFGKNDRSYNISNQVVFCYDIDLKAWWTVTPGVNYPILNMVHIDHEDSREGIGVITRDGLYLMPTTEDDSRTLEADYDVNIVTGELSTQQPQQGWFYLSQMEFRFDYFIGTVTIMLTGIDQFGRKVRTYKTVTHDKAMYNLAEYMRVDLRLQSYRIDITGTARFRLTHFMSKLYTMSAKQGLVWGFDDAQQFRSRGDIHPTFLDYNDIEKAIIP